MDYIMNLSSCEQTLIILSVMGVISYVASLFYERKRKRDRERLKDALDYWGLK